LAEDDAAEPAQAGIPAYTEITTTKSGLKYSVLRAGKGEGRTPQLGDKVKVHYTGWKPDGTKFDSSIDRGTPAEFVCGRVIEGWNEALQLMHVGDLYKLTIPPDLAYGDKAQGDRPTGTLVFQVELLGVTEGIPFPTFRKLDPEKTQSAENGLKWEVLREGTGDTPKDGETVRLHLCFWNDSGKLLDSTWQSEALVAAPLQKFQLGVLREAPKQMKAGGRYRFEVPANLGFGERGAGPDVAANAITYWEIELLYVVRFSLPKDDELEKTKSGLKYRVIRPGNADGKKPVATDEVSVHYAGWTTAGKSFDASYDRGQPATFPVGGVIQGWIEGLQLMSEGAVYQFVIPSDIAYGKAGRPGTPIGPDADLVFYVDLIKVGR
jgi:peptidylprolyl isomerase